MPAERRWGVDRELPRLPRHKPARVKLDRPFGGAHPDPVAHPFHKVRPRELLDGVVVAAIVQIERERLAGQGNRGVLERCCSHGFKATFTVGADVGKYGLGVC